MARRTQSRKMTVQLVERNELLNLRLISQAIAADIKRKGLTKEQ